ncbi:hypothetical protein DD237_002108 [Peronospora effusa]|uniref:Uncharacterized protein n=1 Tax=Peronospora effusa TaxID=542832 RepID=A0A425BYH6_9STRA|nr:hypothetical protein DD237_002108 [Peronospora effusa]
MNQQVVELSTSLPVDVKTSACLVEPEPQLDVFSPTNDLNKNKKKRKKKKNRRKSLEKNELKTMKEKEEATEGQEEGKEVFIEASTGSIEASTMKAAVIEKEMYEEETKDNASESQSMETTSSLDTLKASGTRAVGSLFSRFKLGRKKSLASPIESAMKQVNLSPVEKAGKQLEVPKERRVEGGEQSVPVSAKKDQGDVLEEQKKEEEEEDAMQMTPSSTKLKDGVQKQAKEIKVVDSLLCQSKTDAPESDGQVLAGADSKADVSIEGVTEFKVEVHGPADENGSTATAVETLKHETLIALDTNGPTNEQDITTEVQDENVSASAKIATIETTERNQCSTDVVMSEPVSLKLDLDFDLDLDTDQSIYTTENQVEVEIANNASLQSDKAAVNTFVIGAGDAIASSNKNEGKAIAIEPLVADMVGTATPDEIAQNDTAVSDDIDVNPSVTESVKVVESNEYSPSEAVVVEPLVADMVGTAAPDEIAQNETAVSDDIDVNPSVTESVKVVESNEYPPSEAVVVEPLVADMVGTAAPDEIAQNETAVSDDIDVNPSVTESVKVVESNEYPPSEAVVVEPLVADMVGVATPDEIAQNETAVSDDIDVNLSVTESVKVVESNEYSPSEAVVVEPLVADMVGTATPDEIAENETAVSDDIDVNPSVTESVKVVESNEYSPSEVISTDKMELMAVKVSPPTSELPVVVAAPAILERTSPVKSLASRFEGKKEQSLDSLKFRTVREFFPQERSIRVGAEKKKYEAQAQQQKLKAKAEDKAKAKYKPGSGFKSPEKDAVFGASSPALKHSALAVQESVVTDVNGGDPVVFTTPDTAASRKKFSFDEEYAATDSPSKFSDDVQESLTPVKRIASRFEGKHEQSLDDLKFRTVREFFPDGGKRSIHVGAEKAKYEAIRKQQEEATMTTEHARPKVTVLLPTPTTVERENSVEADSLDAVVTTSLSSLDEVCTEMTTGVTLSSSEPNNAAAVESADDSVKGVAVGSLNVDDEAGTAVEKSPETNCVLSSTSTDTVSITVIKEDMLAAPGVLGVAEKIVDTLVAKPVSVDSGKCEATVEANEKTTINQGSDKAVSKFNTELVELTLADSNRRADTGITEASLANKHASLNIEQNAKREEVEDIELKIDSGLDKQSFGEAVVNTSSEFGGGVIKEGDVDEQVNVLQALTSKNAAEENAANSELIEQNIGKPVEGVLISSSVSTGEVTITGGESESVDIQQFANNNEASTESQVQVLESASSAEIGLTELDLGKADVVTLKEQMKHGTKNNSRPILTTEQLYVMEDDHTIETVETVVVGERPMTDGEDDFEHLSLTKIRPSHEVHSGTTSPKPTKASIKQTSAKPFPKLTRKVSAASVESVKSTSVKLTSANSAVSIPAKCASTTAPTAASMAQKTLKVNKSHKDSLQPKKKRSAPEVKGTVSDAGCIEPPPAAPTVPVFMKRVSITSSSTSSQARNVADHDSKVRHSLRALTTHVSKTKDAVGRSGFVKPSSSTVSVAPKRASITARSASFRARNAAEHLEDINVAVPSAPSRNKRYMNVKSKVFAGIQSGSMQRTSRKTITKEEFIAAERRKSLGSAGVRSVLGAGNRRASLAAGATIAGPPEPFVRSALSRKKLNSTPPRYMNYENAPGYAERARQQYERRKRLEEENAAKSEKRQRELRTFFSNKQQTPLMSRTDDEICRGSEFYEVAKLANESEIADQKVMRAERQRTGPTRSYRRAPSATSSAGTSSSNGVPSRTSKKSSVSSVAEKVVSAPALDATEMESEEVTECTFVTEDTVAGAGIDC